MIKLLNSDDNSAQKKLTPTKYLLVILNNGSAISTFATQRSIDEVKTKFLERKNETVSIFGYDAEYHDDGDIDVLQTEIIFWGNEMSSIKILELNDAPFVEE